MGPLFHGGVRLRALENELRSRQLFDSRSFPAYALLAALATSIAATVLLTDFSYDGSGLNGAFSCLAMFLACALVARWLSFDRFGGAAEAIVLIIAFSLITPLAGVLLASTNFPLADPLLSKLDRTLFFGFDRRTVVNQMAGWPPVFRDALRFIYYSLQPQPAILLSALFLAKQRDKAWHFVTAWMAALLFSLAIFPFVPAVGIPPYEIDFLGTFEGARSGDIRTLDVECLTGIIFFPSFHAAAAVLLAWGFSSVRGAAPLFVPLNVLMFGSALYAGSHYLVDLIAGGAVAWASIVISTKLHKRLALRTSIPST